MKRKLLLAVLAIVVTVSCAVGLAACDLFGEETSHKHQMQHVDAVAATCTEDGSTEYWVCSDCGKYFSDAEGKNEIADLNSTVISANEHLAYGTTALCSFLILSVIPLSINL